MKEKQNERREQYYKEKKNQEKMRKGKLEEQIKLQENGQLNRVNCGIQQR